MNPPISSTVINDVHTCDSDIVLDTATNSGPYSGQGDPLFPVLSLHTLESPPRYIQLPQDQRVLLGRQTDDVLPAPNYFSCKVMSRDHAEIWAEGQKMFIRDLGSTNGTFVNGERLSEEHRHSEQYELKNDDILEFGSKNFVVTDEEEAYSAHVTCTFSAPDQPIVSRSISTVTSDAIEQVVQWIHESGEGQPALYWLTHPDDQERFYIASCIAAHCAESRILCPRLYLSRRSIDGWNLARLLACQLCQYVSGLQPQYESPSSSEALPPFEEVDESWIFEFFVQPLITHVQSPVTIIIDSLDLTKHALLRPLIRLAMIIRMTPKLPVKLLLTTHPDIRLQTKFGQGIGDAHLLKEIHVIYPLRKFSRLTDHGVKQNVFSFVNTPSYAKVSIGPLGIKDSYRSPQRSALATLMDVISMEKELHIILDDLEKTLDPSSLSVLRDAIQMDASCDKRAHSKMLYDVITNLEEKSAARELKKEDAQLFIDFCQEFLDNGALSDFYGHDFDRRARRLVVDIVATSDVLPTSIFLLAGDVVLIHSEPYSGGGFADVFRATYRGATRVALKRLRVYLVNPDRRRIKRRFCKEALTWRPLQHPHVLPFLGVDSNTFPSDLCMVSPWMENGTLSDVRRRYGPHNIDIGTRIFEIALGLEYLHFEKIVHGDLRGANILIDGEQHVRLSDFGLTIFSDATIVTESNIGGSVRWMAPELFIPEEEQETSPLKTEETDIYAFACVYFELYKGVYPFSEISTDAAVMFLVSRGDRPRRPENDGDSVAIPEAAWELVELCWHQDRYSRPSMAHVVERMSSFRVMV